VARRGDRVSDFVATPRFQRVQRQFAAHLRDPAHNPPPRVEPRRMRIYRELIFNNIAGFIRSGFPVLCEILGPTRTDALVRDFIIRHRAESPYFLEIGREFIDYLQGEYEPAAGDPGFLLELAHYEWVELALDVAEIDYPDTGVDPAGDLMSGRPVVSPLAWSLSYSYPVHLLGPEYRPDAQSAQSVFLVVYRNRDNAVGFLESNAVTARLLALLQSGPDAASLTGAVALRQIANELGRHDIDAVMVAGAHILDELRALDIIAGAASDLTWTAV
jgi:hypothetical protein